MVLKTTESLWNLVSKMCESKFSTAWWSNKIWKQKSNGRRNTVR